MAADVAARRAAARHPRRRPLRRRGDRRGPAGRTSPSPWRSSAADRRPRLRARRLARAAGRRPAGLRQGADPPPRRRRSRRRSPPSSIGSRQLSDGVRRPARRGSSSSCSPRTRTTERPRRAPRSSRSNVRPRLIVEAIAQIQDAGVDVDVWKVEGVADAAGCAAIAAAARRDGRDDTGVVVLGAGAGVDTVNRWLEAAAGGRVLRLRRRSQHLGRRRARPRPRRDRRRGGPGTHRRPLPRRSSTRSARTRPPTSRRRSSAIQQTGVSGGRSQRCSTRGRRRTAPNGGVEARWNRTERSGADVGVRLRAVAHRQ